MKRYRCLCALWLLLALLGVAPARAELRPVVLQLQWDHQFQFAGYYAALWQGFFREAGFAVEIRSSFPDGRPVYRSPMTEVTEGRAQFGTANAGILLAQAQGAPVMIVASIFQQSGTRLYYRRGLREISTPADLVGLRLGRNQGNELLDMELRAMLAAEGVDLNGIPVVRYPPDRLLQALAAGEYDMTFGYSLSAPWEQKELGVTFGELRPADFGIAFYGDSLFTHRDLAVREPAMVQRFRDAALRGWAWALANPEEVADRISTEFTRVLPIADVVGFNRFQIPIVRELTLHPIVELGNINPDRWTRMARLLHRAGVLPTAALAERDFLFDPDRKQLEAQAISQRWLLGALAVAVILGGLFVIWLLALRRAVNRIRRDLAQSQAALVASQKLESIGRMTGGVAHDVNNLLQVVTSGLNLLEQPSLDEDQRAMIQDAMRQAVDRGAAVNRQLLAFSAGQELTPDHLDAAACLRGMKDLLGRALREDVRLDLHLPDDAWPVFVDATQLEVAMLNLAVNARDAMPPGVAGGGRLTITLSNEFLAEPPGQADRLLGEFLRVRVSDNGVGLPPSLLEKVFEPFFTTKPRGRGTGLGLAQVYGFARQSGGTARIESHAGKGTSVSILLPRHLGNPQKPLDGNAAAPPDNAAMAAPDTDAPPQAAARTSTPTPMARPMRLLVVEDNADVAALLRATLQHLGHEVREARDGPAALLAMAEWPVPDAVLTDLTMPGGMGGLELAQRLAAEHPHLPVLLMTGFSDEMDQVTQSGLPCLRKPFTREALEAALANAVA